MQLRVPVRAIVCLLLLGLPIANANTAQGSRDTCIPYATVQRPDALRKLCVSAEAIRAVQRGQALPVGVTIRMDVYDATGQHSLGRTSLRVKEGDGWHYIEIVRGNDGRRDAKRFARVSTTSTTTTHDSPTCIACHSVVRAQDEMFTLPQLLAYAKTGQVQMVVCNRLGRRPCGAP